MAQGNLKVKAKLPNNIKQKTQKPKGTAVTKRANRPVKSKKAEEAHKLKQAISKTLNKAFEDEIRARTESQKSLSKAQQAVANYNNKNAIK